MCPSDSMNEALSDVLSSLHSIIESIQSGAPAALSSTALSTLISDAAVLYAASASLSGYLPALESRTCSSTDAVILISALMKSQNLNTFDLALWLARLDQDGVHHV